MGVNRLLRLTAEYVTYCSFFFHLRFTQTTAPILINGGAFGRTNIQKSRVAKVLIVVAGKSHYGGDARCCPLFNAALFSNLCGFLRSKNSAPWSRIEFIMGNLEKLWVNLCASIATLAD
jgi:hypothetical protein